MNFDDELDAHLRDDCWPGCRACADPMDPDLPTRTTQDIRRILEDKPGSGRTWRSRAMVVVVVLLVTAWVVFVAMDLARAGAGL